MSLSSPLDELNIRGFFLKEEKNTYLPDKRLNGGDPKRKHSESDQATRLWLISLFQIHRKSFAFTTHKVKLFLCCFSSTAFLTH